VTGDEIQQITEAMKNGLYDRLFQILKKTMDGKTKITTEILWVLGNCTAGTTT
jgi:hypothetical protein